MAGNARRVPPLYTLFDIEGFQGYIPLTDVIKFCVK